ncbi:MULTISPECIES: phage tail protein [unclassified Pseudomonas]|uniref:phage tail protein n=1 Tax=unclassified Pseudomonas TaxID=196821 RepID=UPI000BD58E7B|nr:MULTISPECIES: phage tail protein [unclassified Pseudomonas]PVZ19919.1 phage-related protein [Pseudomonas sp. URIL14HWK12:I12]PVZ26985.1 phage-related protein [Pseudomonas sp. URIL14HWK12:I10]PVZ37874.1 phage-related protein [Pseudomonas sp. URIL14HWK12:I11]SNZ05323.1 Phage-related protein [Pseudomonas sp. URIL14HWK12:I9]
MAIETFTWPVQTGDAGEITYRVRIIQFGDGYTQTAGDGPNNKEQSFPITHTAPKAKMLEILNFLDRHGGARAFLWTNPLGELGLYRCTDPKPTPMGGGVFKLTATFKQAFHP